MRVNLTQKNLVEEISLKLVTRINKRNEINDLDCKKMKYGLEVLIINLFKTSFIFIMALILGILKETVIIMISFAFIRRYAFGVHAKSSISCTILTSITFFVGAIIPRSVNINNYVILVMFGITMSLLYLYAPADTEARPLTGKDFRKNLKTKALLATSFLIILTFGLTDSNFRFFISYGALCESITITPIVYKLLGRGYKNYENYQKNIA